MEGIRHRGPAKSGATPIVSVAPSQTHKGSPWETLHDTLLLPIDGTSLALFRILFGLLLVVDLTEERGLAEVDLRWGDPGSCHFPLIHSMRPPSLLWMYAIYLSMFLSGLGIALGLLYRASCAVYCCCYWYVFLLDKSSWNNHSYLYGLLVILLLMVDAHQCWSVDAVIFQHRTHFIPAYQLYIFRFQFTLVYFYAGLKKLDRDWVTGHSMRGLSQYWVFSPFRMLLSPDQIDFLLVHLGGLLFDLSEGFLLLFRQSRPLGLILGMSFHLMNSQLFSIGMFPWAMMASMVVYLDPSFPRTSLNHNASYRTELPTKQTRHRVSLRLFSLTIYIVVQLVLPYSHGFTQGYNSWTQGLYGYSWDMMVHSWSTQHARIKVVDAMTKKEHFFQPGAFITLDRRRGSRWMGQPDMMKQYAACIAERLQQFPELGLDHPQVFFDIWKSLNRRFQQRLVDPNKDILTASWSPFHHTPWIMPLLSDLSDWRTVLDGMNKDILKNDNYTDVVFVADFPGMTLENFIEPGVSTNITVLSGRVVVTLEDGKNITMDVNQTLTLPENATHIITTTSEQPSCWSYVYVNQSIIDKSDRDGEPDSPDSVSSVERQPRAHRGSMPSLRSLQRFVYRKLRHTAVGYLKLYSALSHLFSLGEDGSGNLDNSNHEDVGIHDDRLEGGHHSRLETGDISSQVSVDSRTHENAAARE